MALVNVPAVSEAATSLRCCAGELRACVWWDSMDVQ